ncbi:MAG TPA: hypothetical protein VLG47_02375 [Candidatus Saccharimonadales bacterium]|nr:hypothetical protein [Candidatus Saccharimonadales bacterium]
MKLLNLRNQRGTGNIEIVILLVVIAILSGLIMLTHKGIDEKQDNSERQRDVDELQVAVEAYFSQFNQYPTFTDINNEPWRQTYMKGLSKEVLRDPGGSSYQLAGTPAKNIYAYHVTSTNGKTCDNIHSICTEYTLTATFDGGGSYTKKNLD